MNMVIILGLSILFQLIAAIVSLRMIAITGRRIAWILITTAILLMVFRRLVPFTQLLYGEILMSPDLTAEIIALLTSGLMMLGIAAIQPIFLAVKKSEETIRASEKTVRTLLNAPRQSSLLIEKGGKILAANEIAATFLEKPAGEVEGAVLFHLLPRKITEVMKHHVSQVISTGNPALFEYQRKVEIIENSIYPILNAHGQVERLAIFSRDISEIKRVEALLAGRARELARSNKELEQFAYIASHDLQSPLRTITSYAQLLETRYKGALDDNADKFIGYIVEGTTRMHQLINDLLVFSRSGKHAKNPEMVNLNDILLQVLQDLREPIEKSKAAITYDPLPSVHADAGHMWQLLQNLIGNSIKYRGREPLKIHLSATLKEKEWVISVRDNGIGIDPKFSETIFGIFQRLHPRTAFPGTGIGLAICQKIVESYEGRIWVESKPGKGALFLFTLPLPLKENENGL